MSHVGADLPTPHEEVQRRHPLVAAQPRLARKVVEVRHEARHEVREARIVALGVDAVRVGGDVVDCEVEERRSVGVGVGVGHGGRVLVVEPASLKFV